VTFLTREQQRVAAVIVLLLALGWAVKTWRANDETRAAAPSPVAQ
jgi:hypothetical protein